MNRDLDLQQDENGRWVLDGWVEYKDFGIIGHCFAHQPDSWLIKHNEQSFKKNYEKDTQNHRSGEEVVRLICCALNALPGVHARITEWNSIADCCCKWDLLIEWKQKSLFFPVQVKSGSKKIFEAVEQETWKECVQEIEDKLGDNIQLIQTLRQSGGLVKNGKHENKYRLHEESLAKLKVEYSKSMPLYVWASPSEDAVRFFVRTFSKVFEVSEQIEDCEKSAIECYRSNRVIGVFRSGRENLPFPQPNSGASKGMMEASGIRQIPPSKSLTTRVQRID